MVSKESLQEYAEKAFADLPCSVEASRNLNNGKFLLLVSLSEVDFHKLELDENELHSDMASKVRELRDRLFPVGEAMPEQVIAHEAEAAAAELPVEVPATDPAPPLSESAPEVTADEVSDVTPEIPELDLEETQP